MAIQPSARECRRSRLRVCLAHLPMSKLCNQPIDMIFKYRIATRHLGSRYAQVQSLGIMLEEAVKRLFRARHRPHRAASQSFARRVFSTSAMLAGDEVYRIRESIRGFGETRAARSARGAKTETPHGGSRAVRLSPRSRRRHRPLAPEFRQRRNAHRLAMLPHGDVVL